MPELTPEVERELAALDDALAGRRVAPDLAELGELALALREERPRPTEGFGRYLDKRMERGFPGKDPRVRASGRRWWRGWLGPAATAFATMMLIAVIVVTGPHGDQDEGGGGGGATSAAEDAAGGASESTGAAQQRSSSAESADSSSTFAEPLPPGSVPPAPSQGSPRTDARDRRFVERSASLVLAARPRDIDTVSARIQEVTRQQGGFVVSSTVSSSTNGGHGEFELRIPSRNLDAAMAALSRLGAVRERAQSAQDITAQSVSARTRLKDARTERESLLKQLADATTLEEAEAIRARLRIVSREIEGARAEVRRVNNRAAFSTVAVTLVADRGAVAPGAEEDDGAWSPGDAWNDAVRVLEVVAGVALIVLAVALPLGLVVLIAVVMVRVARRRRREHALDAI
jgi:Domain of unknown function (DUF4349)